MKTEEVLRNSRKIKKGNRKHGLVSTDRLLTIIGTDVCGGSQWSLPLPVFEDLQSDDLPETLFHDVGESEHGDSEPAAQKSAHVTEDFAALNK
ncbi:hypothetical protein AVEN_23564-1 [Araneus ventricosus]|uniref:Uncharacterized protein n=1 Tax=Araneus ventricosus TaxID=182803 RepID=A0A4Y2L2E6_ARAVE|nr:hypothetical protein AVEN_23564-1 [Araneus ventricosus]